MLKKKNQTQRPGDKNKRSKNHVISFPEGKGWD